MILDCNSITCWANLADHLLTASAILGGGWWFLYTTQFKPRIQFDLECRQFRVGHNRDQVLLEVAFVFENTGFVEHRLYDLSLSIHGIDDRKAPQREGQRLFDVTLFERQVIVPPKYKWYFVRPGVRQVITHTVVINDNTSLIRVTGGFTYKKRTAWPHTARRVFAIEPKQPEIANRES